MQQPDARPATTSYYAPDELAAIGLRAVGHHVLISRKASIYKPEVISIGNYVRIDDFALLSGGQGIEIGNFVHIASYCGLYGGGGIRMEDFAGIGPRTCIFSESDDFRGLGSPLVPMEYKPCFKSATVVFRKHSAVGSNATILPGVEIGEGGGAGAHALIIKDIEPWTFHFSVVSDRMIRRKPVRIRALEQQFLDAIKAREREEGIVDERS